MLMNRYKKASLFFLVLALPFVFTVPANSLVPASFKFVGSGYGHGVGLSQIGAKGQALAGKSAVEILNYYFPGTSTQPVVDTQTIRVNTAHQVNEVSFSLLKEVETATTQIAIAADTQTPQLLNGPFKFTITGNQILAKASNQIIGNAELWSIDLNPDSYLIQNEIGRAHV